MSTDTLVPPAGFIDPALASEPEIETLKEELAHALNAPGVEHVGSMITGVSESAIQPTPLKERAAAGSADPVEDRSARSLAILRQLILSWRHGTAGARAQAPAAETGGVAVVASASQSALPTGAQKVGLTIHVERRGGASADISVPDAWSAELLQALVALVEGQGVHWAASPGRKAARASDVAGVPVATPPVSRASTLATGDAAVARPAASATVAPPSDLDPLTPSQTDDEIGTGELAKILGVSAPTATAVLNRGEIPFRRTSEGRGHRRVSRAAALEWRRKREVQRRVIGDLVRMAETGEGDGPSLPDGTQGDPDDESTP